MPGSGVRDHGPEVEIHSEIYRRLGRLTEAIDDVAELEDMAGDREHFWLRRGGG
jgi:hypothetical protein